MQGAVADNINPHDDSVHRLASRAMINLRQSAGFNSEPAVYGPFNVLYRVQRVSEAGFVFGSFNPEPTATAFPPYAKTPSPLLRG
jgi:hypothetical protein